MAGGRLAGRAFRRRKWLRICALAWCPVARWIADRCYAALLEDPHGANWASRLSSSFFSESGTLSLLPAARPSDGRQIWQI